MAMELEFCAICETEDTEGILVETRRGPAGLDQRAHLRRNIRLCVTLVRQQVVWP